MERPGKTICFPCIFFDPALAFAMAAAWQNGKIDWAKFQELIKEQYCGYRKHTLYMLVRHTKIHWLVGGRLPITHAHLSSHKPETRVDSHSDQGCQPIGFGRVFTVCAHLRFGE